MASLASTRWGHLWPAVIVLAMLALLPVGNSAEVPMWVGAVAGLVLLRRHRTNLSRDRAVVLVAILFACYWLPTLIASPTAIAPARSWSTAGTLLRFLPFAAFAAIALRDAAIWPRIVAGAAALIVLWLPDAWV